MGRTDRNNNHHNTNNDNNRGNALEANGLVGVVPTNAPGQGLGLPGLRLTDPQQQMPSRPSIGGSPSISPSEGLNQPHLPNGSKLTTLGIFRYPSFPPSFPPGRKRSQNILVDLWQQRFLQDIDEAEPWQKELIQFHRDQTKDRRKSADVGTGTGAGARDSAHLPTMKILFRD